MVTLRTTNRNGGNSKRHRQIKWRWTLVEDNLLKKLVKRHGAGNWDFISDHFQGRTGKSCRLRWINQLDPKVDRTPFSEEERQRLVDLHGKYGNRWSIIVSHFPGRTDNQVKNQYHLLVGNKYKKASRLFSTPLSKGSADGSMSTVAVGLQFSNGTFQGHNNSVMSGVTEMVPVLGDGLSSVFGLHCSSMHPNQGAMSHGDSIMSDASSGALSESCPLQGVSPGEYQFIDFMGVQSSD
ncbi:myb domain protein 56 [Striga hermonthica]|uniref:Myb domain protein 56 n=1 Tax=Striga hermonthica TaxID=68872 RepID=A0A9N7NWL3_STRHE|nr:myb domain protein 56 [Striga hermonthica]